MLFECFNILLLLQYFSFNILYENKIVYILNNLDLLLMLYSFISSGPGMRGGGGGGGGGFPHNIFLISPQKHMKWVLIRSA